jgi:hypothetical protein
MSETHGTAQATESTATTIEGAAERIASLISDDGDIKGDETQEAKASEAAETEEAEASEDDAEQSDETAEDADDSEEAPQTFTVKIDGEEQTVTLDELTRGYSRQADYTRKTMALAEERKALDADKAQSAQDREAYAEALTKLEAFFASAEQDDAAALAELRHTDPAEYAARVAEKQERANQLQAVKAERERLDAEKQRETASKRAEMVKEEEAKLLARLPEWSDPAKRKEGQAQVVDYAISSLGLTPEEVNDIFDHRLVVALSKAAKWDALQAKKPTVQAKVDAVKTAKPGAASHRAPVSDLTRSKQRLAKTGRMQDAAAALEHLI